MPIVHRRATVKEIRLMLRESPLAAVRQMLPDAAILEACRKAGHRFRQRLYDPVVTVLHYLAQAIQREESFAATWQELWAPLAADFPEVATAAPDPSALTHARSRLPKAVVQYLVARAIGQAEDSAARWRDLRLVALDGASVSMPRTPELFAYFGVPRARKVAVRYPLARFCSLLAVQTSTILDYRFGPFTKSETVLATEMLKTLGPGDLMLADRYFSGAPMMARFQARGAHFLMRKHHLLKVENVRILQRLGPLDSIVELPVSKPARRQDPTLPETVRVRLFHVSWKSPSGQRLSEWFVTSLIDSKRFGKRTLAMLYYLRWQSETSYLEFKQTFHADVLRSKTVQNVEKEFAAHVLAYQLVRRLILSAAQKHHQKPTEISFLGAARNVLHFSHRMAAGPAWALPIYYERLLDAIAANQIAVRPGRLEPRAIAREWHHYPRLTFSRAEWRRRYLEGTG
jgi:hypothetical protein